MEGGGPETTPPWGKEAYALEGDSF